MFYNIFKPMDSNLVITRNFLNSNLFARLSKLIMRITTYVRAVKTVKHFSKYLQPILATDQSITAESLRIRHKVYCEELKFESESATGLEQDEFDTHALHCLIQHTPSAVYAGTVRIVYSKTAEQLLPIEKYCSHSINENDYHPSNFKRESICEISRLAVPANFRRRQSDQYSGAATGLINSNVYSEKELRCFPFIAVGLYLLAAKVILDEEIEHCYVMVEPRLARSLRVVGIHFIQIGPVVDYHGKRAPYYIKPSSIFETLSPIFLKMYSSIDKQINRMKRSQNP